MKIGFPPAAYPARLLPQSFGTYSNDGKQFEEDLGKVVEEHDKKYPPEAVQEATPDTLSPEDQADFQRFHDNPEAWKEENGKV